MLKRAVLDLSHWNGDVDMDKIKGDGIVGIIHKATEGSTYEDDTYDVHQDAAMLAGLRWGAYHFMRPGDQVEQAKRFVNFVGVDVHTLYCADYEDQAIPLSHLKVFLNKVHELTGRPPVLYSGHVLKEKLSGPDDDLAVYPLWIAHYTNAEQPTWPTETWPHWWLWQWTEEGTCPGIEGYCDVNAFEGSARLLEAEWAGWRLMV
jgi:lysozyme